MEFLAGRVGRANIGVRRRLNAILVNRVQGTGLFFQQRGLGIDQMNPSVLPDVLEMPVKNENAELNLLTANSRRPSQILIFAPGLPEQKDALASR